MRVTRAGFGHGDILVMDGECQDEFLHCTNPRNGLTSRSVGSNSMLPPVLFLGQELHVVCQRVRGVHQFLIRGIWVLGSVSFAILPVVHRT